MSMSSGKQSFPVPTIDYAVGDLLDPGKVPATGTTVHCTYPFAAAVRVDMYWEGVSLHTDFKVVPSGGVPQVDFPITQALVIANLNTTVQVYYLVDGVASARQPLRIQAGALDLPAPTVKDASGGVLDPMKVLTGATVTVAYDDMLSTDTLAPIWNGRNDVIEWKPGNASKSVDFLVPASLVAASLGKTFDVDYGVLREGKVLASQVLRLTVSPLPESELLKSRPVITEANQTTSVLDLNSFTGNAHVMVAKWPLIGVGQTVWLTVSGPNGEPTLKLLEAYPIVQSDVSNGLGREIPRIELEEFADGSMLTVVCEVAFDGGVSKVTFPTTTYTVKQVDKLSIDTSLMLLDGRLIHGWDLEPTAPPANTYKDRAATGGVLPYTYRSSNEAVAYVNEVTGRVFSVGNGSAHITVTDLDGHITSYPITVSNVLQIFNTNLLALYRACANQAASMGGHILTLDEWREFRSAYKPNHKEIPSDWCWSSTPADGDGTTWLFGPDNGQSLSQPPERVAPGFGLIGLLPVDPEPQITITNMYYSTLFELAPLHPLTNGAHLPRQTETWLGTDSRSPSVATPPQMCRSYFVSVIRRDRLREMIGTPLWSRPVALFNVCTAPVSILVYPKLRLAYIGVTNGLLDRPLSCRGLSFCDHTLTTSQ